MTAVSLSLNRGANMVPTSITVGSSAPGVGDMEFRFNVLDTHSKNLNLNDLIQALELCKIALLAQGPKVQITNQPSGPPN
jgi:hypothetical protein